MVGDPEDQFSSDAVILNLRDFYKLCRREIINMSRLVGKQTMWFLNRSDTNRFVQAQKRARTLKFRI